MGLAELQLSSGVVVHVVDAHFLHDAETSLRRRDGDSDRDGEEVMLEDSRGRGGGDAARVETRRC